MSTWRERFQECFCCSVVFWCSKRIQNTATGKPYFATRGELTPKETRTGHCMQVILCVMGGIAILVFLSLIVADYARNDLLKRKAIWYESAKAPNPYQFPVVVICNNVPLSEINNQTSQVFPQNKGCYRTSFSGDPRKCTKLYVQSNLSLSGRSCLRYQGETSDGYSDILRLLVDVGGDKSFNNPWEGAFMFLKHPKSKDTVSLTDESSSNFYILSPKRYFLVHIEERQYKEHDCGSLSDKSTKDVSGGKVRYKVLTPESAPLRYSVPNMTETTVVIDFRYDTSDILYVHTYCLRSWLDLLSDLGGTLGLFGLFLFLGGVFFTFCKTCCSCTCRQERWDCEKSQKCCCVFCIECLPHTDDDDKYSCSKICGCNKPDKDKNNGDDDLSQTTSF